MRIATQTVPLFMLIVLLGAAGCGRVVFTPQNGQPAGQPIALSPQQQQALAMQQEQLQNRARALDSDNQGLETLLAQSRQQTQLMRDQVVATSGDSCEQHVAATFANGQLAWGEC